MYQGLLISLANIGILTILSIVQEMGYAFVHNKQPGYYVVRTFLTLHLTLMLECCGN